MSDVEWRIVPGFEIYEASSAGELRRTRTLQYGPQIRKILRQTKHHSGYLMVSLRRDGRQVSVLVHRAIALAFHGVPDKGAQARHIDGDKANNLPGNLRWGTASENTLDQVRHGTHHLARRTHCPKGHPLEGGNVIHEKAGRKCRACKNQQQKAAADRRRAASKEMK